MSTTLKSSAELSGAISKPKSAPAPAETTASEIAAELGIDLKSLYDATARTKLAEKFHAGGVFPSTDYGERVFATLARGSAGGELSDHMVAWLGQVRSLAVTHRKLLAAQDEGFNWEKQLARLESAAASAEAALQLEQGLLATVEQNLATASAHYAELFAGRTGDPTFLHNRHVFVANHANDIVLATFCRAALPGLRETATKARRAVADFTAKA